MQALKTASYFGLESTSLLYMHGEFLADGVNLKSLSLCLSVSVSLSLYPPMTRSSITIPNSCRDLFNSPLFYRVYGTKATLNMVAVLNWKLQFSNKVYC